MKKGFTLIELLAVIVILAIIALIATPIILGVVENARKSAAGSSALGYLDAVEKAIALDGLDNIVYPTGDIDILTSERYKDIEVQGEAPSKGSLVVSDRYLIERATLCVNNYKVELEGHKIKSITKDGCDDMGKPQTCDPGTAVKFNDSTSWSEIAEAVRNGQTCGMKVGDTKKVIFGFYNREYTLRIANTTTPDECKKEGFSQTACGFVIEFVDIIDRQKMTTAATNAYIWYGSDIRSYLNCTKVGDNEYKSTVGDDLSCSFILATPKTTLYDALPQEIRNAIIDTYVVSGHGKDDHDEHNHNYTTTDKLYLLSPHEVWENGEDLTIDNDSAWDNTRQLDYYHSIGVTTDNFDGAKKYLLDGIADGTAWTWWLRSPDLDSTESCHSVSYGGNHATFFCNPKVPGGVSPAFRIG